MLAGMTSGIARMVCYPRIGRGNGRFAKLDLAACKRGGRIQQLVKWDLIPGYVPEEMFDIAQKLYKMSRYLNVGVWLSRDCLKDNTALWSSCHKVPMRSNARSRGASRVLRIVDETVENLLVREGFNFLTGGGYVRDRRGYRLPSA
jgi:hypothetical protein